MRKVLRFVLLLAAAATACSKAPVVEVTASFKLNKEVLQVGEELLIENTSEVKNNILAFCKWEYGNDQAGETVFYGLELDEISFAEPGLYTLSLTAYAEQGAGQDTYSRKIMVIDENDIPWADFEYPQIIKVGQEVEFKDKSIDRIGGIKTWEWNIGGRASSFDSPLVTFDAPATGVEVSLTVTDAFGASDSVTKTIDITL